MFTKLIAAATVSLAALTTSAVAEGTWVEALDKAEAYEITTGSKGFWVRGSHSDAAFKRLAGFQGHMFGNVLADDVVLPRITDVRKVLAAIEAGSKPIIVASNDWILPSNAMLCEIAAQLEMDCALFTEMFYRLSAKDENGNYDEAKGVSNLKELEESVVSQVEALGLEFDISENGVSIDALNAAIAALEANALATAAEIVELKATNKAKIAMLTADHAKAVSMLKADFSVEKATALANLEAELVASHVLDKASALANLEAELVASNALDKASALDNLEAELATAHALDKASALADLGAELATAHAEATTVLAESHVLAIESLNNAHSEIVSDLNAKYNEAMSANETVVDALNSQVEALKAEAGVDADKIAELNLDLTAALAKQEELQDFLDTKEGQLTVANEATAAAEAQVVVLEAEVEVLEGQLVQAKLNAEANALFLKDHYGAKVAYQEGLVDALNIDVAGLEGEITDLNNTITTLENIITTYSDLAAAVESTPEDIIVPAFDIPTPTFHLIDHSSSSQGYNQTFIGNNSLKFGFNDGTVHNFTISKSNDNVKIVGLNGKTTYVENGGSFWAGIKHNDRWMTMEVIMEEMIKESYETGYDKGYEEGYNEGYNDGFTVGFAAGVESVEG